MTPHGVSADFVDSHLNGVWARFAPVYEKAATIYRNAQYKYVAQQLAGRALERIAKSGEQSIVANVNVGAGVGSAFGSAHRWADDSVKPHALSATGRDVLEDVVGKKIVFRDGWDRTSVMMLLNYRDEGDGGWLGRDYLRQNLSVEEEKTHHGHADENSVALLMSGGSVLLHDAGYRPDLPSGQYGAWRADYFHNRVVARKNKRDKTQNVFEFLRNSGAYRRVHTQKIDFLKFKDVDASRTRLIDDELGYQWDRVITWLRGKETFVVIDGIKILRPDYYTFTNLWHTRRILSQGERLFDTAIDRIGADELPQDKSLLVYFPENTQGKQIGTFPISRHFQDETAVYQTVSSSYKAGDYEFFVTILRARQARGDDNFHPANFRLLEVDKAGKAIGLEITDGQEKSVVCVKLDLEMDLAREPVGPRYQFDLGRVKYGDFVTDASYLFATIKSNEVSYSAATMTRILYRDQTLMEALPNTFGLQLDGAPPRTGYARWRFWEDTVKLKD